MHIFIREWTRELIYSRGREVWNDTVANLTLMALGSSAPEILLSVIELFGSGMFSGELGPSFLFGALRSSLTPPKA